MMMISWGCGLQSIIIDCGSHRAWKMSFYSKFVIFMVYVNLPEGNFDLITSWFMVIDIFIRVAPTHHRSMIATSEANTFSFRVHICKLDHLFWLVLWNFFYFSRLIGNVIIPTDVPYFSEGQLYHQPDPQIIHRLSIDYGISRFLCFYRIGSKPDEPSTSAWDRRRKF